MKYPDDFNTPAFPAGKYVAVSRFMGTVVMLLFLVIMCLCGVIVWTKKSQNVIPFLVSVNSYGGRWSLVTYDKTTNEIPAYYVLQESFLNKFVRDWFTISDDISVNRDNWKKCNRMSDDCKDNVKTCAIYCGCSDKVFEEFEKVVLPVFSDIESKNTNGWKVQSVVIKPVDSIKFITQQGGMWQFTVVVDTGTKLIRFLGYAQISLENEKTYPRTLGYYVSEFNTYRIN